MPMMKTELSAIMDEIQSLIILKFITQHGKSLRLCRKSVWKPQFILDMINRSLAAGDY